MNNPRIKYFEQEDVLHLVITEEPENQKRGTQSKHYRRTERQERDDRSRDSPRQLLLA